MVATDSEEPVGEGRALSDNDPLLGLVDDLLRMELPEGLTAVTIEVQADGFAVSVSRNGQSAATATARVPEEAPVEENAEGHPRVASSHRA